MFLCVRIAGFLNKSLFHHVFCINVSEPSSELYCNTYSALVCGYVLWEFFVVVVICFFVSSASFLHIWLVQDQVLCKHFRGSQPDWVVELKLCPEVYII